MPLDNTNTFPCPICGCELGVDPWKDNNPTNDICSCCGIEFGYEDSRPTPAERALRHAELRQAWIGKGMPWWSTITRPPHGWDPREQLKRIGVVV